MKIISSLLICSLPLMVFPQFRIVGKLVSSSTGEPIPYATIIDIENNSSGTTTNEQGEFKLLMPSGSKNNWILISMVAYQDTILTASQLAQTSFPLKLKDVIQTLDDVVYIPGDEQFDICQPFGETLGVSIDLSLKSLGGAYFHKKNQQGIISSVSICIAEFGHPTAPFLIRLLTNNEGKAKNNYMNPITKMSDVFPDPIIAQASGPGWLEIDLTKYEAALPKKDFFVLISPIDEGEKYKWISTKGEERYGVTIASYDKKEKDIQVSLSHRETVYPLTHKKHRSPAIAITYLAPKK